jgi:hypothetical protein
MAGGYSLLKRALWRLDLAVWLGWALLCTGTDSTKRTECIDRLREYEEFSRFLDSISSPMAAAAPISAGGAAPFSIFVTTNRGLFVLDQGAWRCLLPVTCFGIARHEDRIYLGASAGIYSFILAGQIVAGPNAPCLRNLRILLKYETRYHGERIHQIAYDATENQVVCANCHRNSILNVDASDGRIIDEQFVFVDGTGLPVYRDQNHINSVTPHGDAMLFTAHSAADFGGAIGFISGDRVRAYRYKSRGIHDVVIHDGALMFTDSFRDEEASIRPDVSGVVRYRGREYLAKGSDAIRCKMVLRGLAMRGKALVVGYSAWVPRAQRFNEENGGVLAFAEDGSCAMIEGPFSQVYDVLPIDGVRTDKTGGPYRCEELHAMFSRDVGPLLYDRSVVRSAKVPLLR